MYNICMHRLRMRPSFLAVGVLLLLAPWATGLALKDHAWTKPAGEPLKVAALQGNVDPSIAASTIPIHPGCSPNSARCSEWLTVISVLDRAMARARSRMASAPMPHIEAAHSAVFCVPSVLPRR